VRCVGGVHAINAMQFAVPLPHSCLAGLECPRFSTAPRDRKQNESTSLFVYVPVFLYWDTEHGSQVVILFLAHALKRAVFRSREERSLGRQDSHDSLCDFYIIVNVEGVHSGTQLARQRRVWRGEHQASRTLMDSKRYLQSGHEMKEQSRKQCRE
jgi:hypothetical protein